MYLVMALNRIVMRVYNAEFCRQELMARFKRALLDTAERYTDRAIHRYTDNHRYTDHAMKPVNTGSVHRVIFGGRKRAALSDRRQH